jgi:hypothetical protein
LDQSNLSSDETILGGQNAWARVRDDHAREDWIHVGAALVIGRTEAMCDAHVNEPVGHNYNTVFRTCLRRWLRNHQGGRIAKTTTDIGAAWRQSPNPADDTPADPITHSSGVNVQHAGALDIGERQ